MSHSIPRVIQFNAKIHSNHITPRFTQQEIEPAILELERRNEALQQRVNELEKQLER